MIVDKSGSLASVKRHDYLPFGEELLAGTGGRAQGYVGDSVRQKFTGYERDAETGLNFAQARYQSSIQGRFISVDPLGGGIKNPQSLNRYVYVLNNPLRLVDPSGLKEKDPWNRLTRDQQNAIEGKLDRQQVKTKNGTRTETAQEAFNRLVSAGGATKEQVAERVATVQNFIGAAGGYSNSAQWQQISKIERVGRNTVEVLVSDSNKFLDALEGEGYQVKSRSWTATAKEWLGGTSGDHPYDSARSLTPTTRNVQFHYADDRAEDPNYGGNYWFFHFDITSSNSRQAGPIGDAAGGRGHRNNGSLTPDQVRRDLIDRDMVPISSGCYAGCQMPN